MVLSSRRRGLPSRIAAPAIAFCLVSSLGVPAGAAVPETAVGATADPLPIRDVVLFSSGVGYFQRDGSIANAADIPLTFPAAEVQDILKSLILIDPAGRVQPVTYTSEEPLDKTLQSFGIDVSGNVSMAGLLEQLRGVAVRIVTKGPNPETIEGQVLSVESHTIRVPETGPGVTQDVSSVNLVTDTGIRSVKLDDIGSLTIQDPVLAAQLKQALGLLASGHDQQQKTVTLHFGAAAARQVEAGYVTEAPVWKTSYRLALDNTKKPYMQGWAMVDNTTDHDWKDVNLTLVSGQPISFLQNLYSPLYIPRPVVPPDVQYNPYPQLSEDNVMENAKAAIAQSADESASAVAAAPPPGAFPGMGGGGFGGARATMSAAGPAVRMNRNGEAIDQPLALEKSGVSSAATGQKAGELFEYRIKEAVTIPRKQSAMIPIVTDSVQAEKLDLYNAESDPLNPRNALELTNTTGLHLKAGPMTVLDGGVYAGDARVPELQPSETQLLSYAVDLGVTAVRQDPGTVSHLMSLAIKHGVLYMTYRNEVTTNYTFKSKIDHDRTLMIEQPIKDGWTLTEPAKPDEKTRTYYRFRLPLPAGKSTAFKTVEQRTEVQTIAILDADINTLIQWRRNAVASPALQTALEGIVQKKQRLSSLQDQLNAQKASLESISAEQNRIRQNMAQLDRNSDLYLRYVRELSDQETQVQKIHAEIERLQGEITTAQSDLDESVNKLDAA